MTNVKEFGMRDPSQPRLQQVSPEGGPRRGPAGGGPPGGRPGSGAPPFSPRETAPGASRSPDSPTPPREGEELLALAQEAGSLGIFEWDVRRERVRLSPKLQTLYGLTEFDGRYASWLGRVFRDDVVRVTNAFEEAFAARDTEIVLEFRINRPGDDAPRWMETRNIVFYDAKGNPERLIAVSVDVTDRKRALIQLHAFTDALEERVRQRTRDLEAENEARAKAEESLRHAHKMEAVGQLTGGVAHDFNNLLTVIMGGLEMIERQLPSLPKSQNKERIARAAAMSREGAERAAKLTARLLAFARRQPLSPQPIDANKLVVGIAVLLRRTVGATIALAFHPQDELWATLADPNQLENALLNLALNARDAMRDGGKLTIETRNCELDAVFVAALEEPIEPGEYVMIAVADTGTGMDKATIGHAFEPFFTTKDVGKGTGLGLSQVYGFVRQSAGHVRIDSELGLGSTIKIYLPRHSGVAGEVGVARKRSAGRAAGARCILVVEDDATLRGYTVGVLRRFGYHVLEAENGSAAMGLLRREHGIELLFTDIVMPGGMNGCQLADAALALRPDLKVLFTTGYSRNALEDDHRPDAGVPVIAKPFSSDALAAKVRGVLGRK
jgi:signal transduction histidine kinase